MFNITRLLKRSSRVGANQVRRISSLLDPADEHGWHQIQEQMKRGREGLKYHPSLRTPEIGGWPRFNMKLDTSNPTFIQEMGSHFTRRGQSASLRVGAAQTTTSVPGVQVPARTTETDSVVREKSDVACAYSLEDSVMGNSMVYDCFVSPPDQEHSTLLAQVILYDDVVDEQFLEWINYSGWGVYKDIDWQFVESIDIECPGHKVQLQKRQRIVGFLEEYGSNRALDIEEFASFCDEFNISKSSDNLFAKHDIDGDGLLNFSEFKKFVDTLVF